MYSHQVFNDLRLLPLFSGRAHVEESTHHSPLDILSDRVTILDTLYQNVIFLLRTRRKVQSCSPAHSKYGGNCPPPQGSGLEENSKPLRSGAASEGIVTDPPSTRCRQRAQRHGRDRATAALLHAHKILLEGLRLGRCAVGIRADNPPPSPFCAAPDTDG